MNTCFIPQKLISHHHATAIHPCLQLFIVLTIFASDNAKNINFSLSYSLRTSSNALLPSYSSQPMNFLKIKEINEVIKVKENKNLMGDD